MEDWFADAKHVTALEVESCFMLQEDFYYGPDSFPELNERKLVEPLKQPGIHRHVPSLLRTSEAENNVEELARYYADVISLAKRHQLPFNHISHYFWMRFWIWNTAAEIHLSFPWYDTQSEIDGFIQSVIEKTDGQVFWDADQGWELEIHAFYDKHFARLRDPDSNETHAIVSYPGNALTGQLLSLQSRSRLIIERLTSIIGRDLWTRHVEWPEFLDG
jgi:hypothetical protein